MRLAEERIAREAEFHRRFVLGGGMNRMSDTSAVERMLHNLSDMQPFWARVRQVVVEIVRDAVWSEDDPAERLMRALRARPIWASRAMRRVVGAPRVRLFEEPSVSVHPDRPSRARIVIERSPSSVSRRPIQTQTMGEQFRVKPVLLYDRMRLTEGVRRAFIDHLLDGTQASANPASQ